MSDTENNFAENFTFACLRRNWQQFVSVDLESRDTKNQLKSSTVIRNETLRHAQFHRNVIHCYSRFR
jgi:hypothetical protein